MYSIADVFDLHFKQNLPEPVTSDLSLKSDRSFTLPQRGQILASPLRKSRIVS